MFHKINIPHGTLEHKKPRKSTKCMNLRIQPLIKGYLFPESGSFRWYHFNPVQRNKKDT